MEALEDTARMAKLNEFTQQQPIPKERLISDYGNRVPPPQLMGAKRLSSQSRFGEASKESILSTRRVEKPRDAASRPAGGADLDQNIAEVTFSHDTTITNNVATKYATDQTKDASSRLSANFHTQIGGQKSTKTDNFNKAPMQQSLIYKSTIGKDTTSFAINKSISTHKVSNTTDKNTVSGHTMQPPTSTKHTTQSANKTDAANTDQ